MKHLTIEEIQEWGAMPPSEMLERIQRRFVEEFRDLRASLPSYARNHGIITDLLKNPIWGQWGQIGSYTAARKILDRYWPEWAGMSDSEDQEAT